MQKIEDDPITTVTLSSMPPVPLPPHHQKVFPVATKPPKSNQDVPDVTGTLCDTTISHPLGQNSPRDATMREGTAPREDATRRTAKGEHGTKTREDATRRRGRMREDIA